MALFDDEGRNFLWGLGVGLAAAFLGREVLPAFKGVGRPLAKATLKSGIVLFEKSRETLAHLSEELEDLVVEVKAELEQEAQTTASIPPTAPIPPPPPTSGKVN